jgi:NAD(P)-dependent dehydrogenase (short-subunit alcohol dehydrogenase family)
MAVAVITGSTRGIGFGMAHEFLKQGHSVVVSGRSQMAVDQAVAPLSAEATGDAKVIGQPCDVGDVTQVQALWEAAVKEFGTVDFWVNNAGLIHSYINIAELPTEEFSRIVKANLSGVIHGTQVATTGLRAQPGGGWIYNMEGFGSDGMTRPGLTLYGTTKRAVTYFTACAIKELKDTPVKVGYLNPGIVMTELGMGDTLQLSKEERRKKKFLMLIGDTVEDVTSYLVVRILTNTKHGRRIAWLSPFKLLGRVLLSPFHKRDPFTKAGY